MTQPFQKGQHVRLLDIRESGTIVCWRLIGGRQLYTVARDSDGQLHVVWETEMEAEPAEETAP